MSLKLRIKAALLTLYGVGSLRRLGWICVCTCTWSVGSFHRNHSSAALVNNFWQSLGLSSSHHQINEAGPRRALAMAQFHYVGCPCGSRRWTTAWFGASSRFRQFPISRIGRGNVPAPRASGSSRWHWARRVGRAEKDPGLAGGNNAVREQHEAGIVPASDNGRETVPNS